MDWGAAVWPDTHSMQRAESLKSAWWCDAHANAKTNVSTAQNNATHFKADRIEVYPTEYLESTLNEESVATRLPCYANLLVPLVSRSSNTNPSLERSLNKTGNSDLLPRQEATLMISDRASTKAGIILIRLAEQRTGPDVDRSAGRN